MVINKSIITVSLLSLSLGLAGCSNTTKTQRTAIGAGAGALVGGVVGHQINHKNGAVFGALAGALAGGAIGHYMDSQQEQLEKSLASSGITVTRIDQATIKLNIPDAISFDTGKSDIKVSAYRHLNKLSTTFNKFDQTVIHIMGHTDSVGSDQSNLVLSQQRARSVSSYLSAQDVASNRLATQGVGKTRPIASNATEAGRAQNRRVEIYIRAIERGNEQAAYRPL